MIHKDLYKEVLIKPGAEGADTLKIISGYATPAMAFHHLEDLKKRLIDVRISLLIGMCPFEGIPSINHKGFLNIRDSNYAQNFSCGYIYYPPPVHTKLYIWYKDDKLYKSFIGSANYTQNAFLKNQREAMAEVCGEDISAYFNLVERDSIYCDNQEVVNFVRICNDRDYFRRHPQEEMQDALAKPPQNEFRHTTISLISTRTGEVQRVGGLNWGHRDNSNHNEAYIQLPRLVYRGDFFPPKPNHFTVTTDDNKTFICCRAQKDKAGHAIETPHNNALLGEYFRNRMGLANGAFITRNDLERYGRTDVTFFKFDNENYYMDFSV